MSAIDEFIEKLDALDGPDLDLDRQIHAARGLWRYGPVKAYTGTVNDALILKPQDCVIVVAASNDDYEATVWRQYGDIRLPMEVAYARTAPLAICLAAFYRLQTQEREFFAQNGAVDSERNADV